MIDKKIYTKEEKMLECFNQFDRDNDGLITKADLKKELCKNEYYKNKEEKFFDSLLKEGDFNQDGIIDLKDFKLLMNSS